MFGMKNVLSIVVLLLSCVSNEDVSSDSVSVTFISSKGVLLEKRYPKDTKIWNRSGYIRRAAQWGVGVVEISCDPGVFDMAARLFEGCLADRVTTDDTIEILNLTDFLCIDQDCEAEYYARLARKTVEPHGEPETDGGCEELIERLLQGCRGTQALGTYMQQLLRVCAEENGMCVCACEESRTLHIRHCSGEHTGTSGFDESWMLRIEISGAYRSHLHAQWVVVILVRFYGICRADVDVLGWTPEDNVAIKCVMEKTPQQTKLGITCYRVKPEMISEHMQELRSGVARLDVSENKGLDITDWKTVGEMAGLERLSMGSCNIEPGRIAEHLKELKHSLVELDVSCNIRLSGEDWKTIGGMAALTKLCIKCCNIEPGRIAEHLRELKGSLAELDVSGNYNLSDEDSEIIGGMAKLLVLRIMFCNTEPGRIAENFGELKHSLVELYVSGNYGLSDEDWETIGGMAKLKKLWMGYCEIKPGRIADNFEELRSSLVELDVSYNEKLNSRDWLAIGRMSKLEKLNMEWCEIEPGWIAENFEGLRKSLVELDVSWNRGLEQNDWWMIGRMTGLKKLDIKWCGIEPERIAENLGELGNSLVELCVFGNCRLSDKDWEAIGWMLALKRLNIVSCAVEAGRVAECLKKLKSSLVELDVSGNYGLDDKDWEAIGGMQRLEKLIIRGCNMGPGGFAERFKETKNSLAELDVLGNYRLGDKDWRAIGGMPRLQRLRVVGCDIKPGRIAENFGKLGSSLLELYVSGNRKLSEKDWEVVGGMSRLERLRIVGCGMQPEIYTKYLEGHKCRIEGYGS